MTGDRMPWIRPARPQVEDGTSPVVTPQLDRGIVWSDLVAEMEAEWAARQPADLPDPDRELGDAA